MITKELSQPFDVITPVTMKLTAYTKPIHQLHLSTRHAGDPPAEVRHRLFGSRLYFLGSFLWGYGPAKSKDRTCFGPR